MLSSNIFSPDRNVMLIIMYQVWWYNPPPDGGVPWDDLRKIFTKGSQMAKVPNGVETLPKISIA